MYNTMGMSVLIATHAAKQYFHEFADIVRELAKSVPTISDGVNRNVRRIKRLYIAFAAYSLVGFLVVEIQSCDESDNRRCGLLAAVVRIPFYSFFLAKLSYDYIKFRKTY